MDAPVLAAIISSVTATIVSSIVLAVNIIINSRNIAIREQYAQGEKARYDLIVLATEYYRIIERLKNYHTQSQEFIEEFSRVNLKCSVESVPICFYLGDDSEIWIKYLAVSQRAAEIYDMAIEPLESLDVKSNDFEKSYENFKDSLEDFRESCKPGGVHTIRKILRLRA